MSPILHCIKKTSEGGGRGKLPLKYSASPPRERVARGKEGGREREEVVNVYYLGAMIANTCK